MSTPLRTTVLAVHRDAEHRFSKEPVPSIVLEAGLGVAGDAHHGRTVQHRSRARKYPHLSNLRQVHLISASLLDHLLERDFVVAAGELGENITLQSAPGLQWPDLIALPAGTRLHFSQGAVVELTGLRNPCSQMDRFQRGLMAAMLDKDASGNLVRKTGVMGIVLAGGTIAGGDTVQVQVPLPPHRSMECV
ncbi:MOSC domain-containing protein [Paracidovorax cattleyae]|uniref:MOSC domain-containing protein YiiM n=1 Tax=Paracidovorax cattleyae TaxID=80868 RepID=A0A1H0SUJ8_9BURK|nr:MOSC domain-containing protein [Paracidovorax cattleyae]AVS74586.1 MOSC domain-containing protein [Paracidovorax cattleyae]MBF9264041.1 MOSC domain-containing protein [Paracidovorax cattleyae]SDP45364.1 MOSC domain-containing protein YiiM [Paracidovorax cattleyae]